MLSAADDDFILPRKASIRFLNLHRLEVQLEQIVIDHGDVDHVIHNGAEPVDACCHAAKQGVEIRRFSLSWIKSSIMDE